MIDVTCAIVIDKGKVLAVQRSESMHMPLKWEFPGGKVEQGEDYESSLVREVKEELDLTVQIIGSLMPVEYDYADFTIQLIPFLAKIISGQLCLTEHKDHRWLSWDELFLLDWAEADKPVVGELRENREWFIENEAGLH